jgi:hypothetical protein
MSWIGIDGEGVGRYPHRYILLCSNTADGAKPDYVEDVNGLSTGDCLDFLLRLEGEDVAGYYLTYDWTKILADLPNRDLYRLLRPELRLNTDNGRSFSHVIWGKYRLHYLAGMMRIARGKKSVTVWDVGKFYQSRFVSALEGSGIAPSELITRLKGERGNDTWTEDRLDQIREYCLEECQYLARLVELLQRQHEAVGIKLSAWHGPGSSAGAALEKYGVRKHLADLPPDAQHAAECAYFGGRFEHAVAGTRPGIWSYDIRSAYPAAAVKLPCLAHAEWVRVKREPKRSETALVRYRVTDIGSRVWGPLPCRLPDDSIVWPRGGSSGWVWSVEYWPARDGWQGVEFGGEAWVLRRRCKCEPFGFLRQLYEWRVAQPENKQVLKLIINSVYGRLAQTVGGGGKYSSRAWAGMITASCRARMLELIHAHADERNLYAIATDGAYSSERLPIDGPGLGEWEVAEKGEMVFLRPGIYWATKDIKEWYGEPQSEKRRDKAMGAVKARGVGRRTMLHQVETARAAVERGDERVQLGTSTQFGNARECVYRTPKGVIKRSLAYGEWVDMPVSLSLKAEPKRAADWRPPMLDGIESAPYVASRQSTDARLLQLVGSMLEGRMT